MSSKMRKLNHGIRSNESSTFKRPHVSCILHVSNLPDYGIFTPFSRVQGGADDRLAKLQTMRNRRLFEPLTSNYRMKEVCNQIPEDLDDVDMDNTGYYRHGYQRFTANLHI